MSYSVLLCDDAVFMRAMIGGIISQAGYEVVGEAENGREAVQRYAELKPDVVVLDIVMPDMSGLDALRAIRQANPDACVVMCSAMGQQKLMEEAIAAGARGFIVKPFNPSRVLEALTDAMN